MLEEALSYPTKGDNGLARIAIGGVVVLLATVFQFIGAFTLFLGIGLLFLVAGWVLTFPVYGYAVEVLASVSRKDDEPPEFEDWADLTVTGFKAFVASLVYLIPAGVIVVVFMTIFGAGVGQAAQEGDLGAVFAGIGIAGMLLSFVAYVAVLYVLPAAITNIGREGRFGAAFDFTTIGRVITNSSYIVATLLAIAVTVVAGVLWAIAWATIVLGLILVVLGPFIQFWFYLVFAYLYGAAFGEAVEDTRRDAGEDAAVA